MEKVPASVKEFSKEHAPEERKRAAEQIRAHRKEYFQNKETLTAEIHELASQIQERQADKETIVQEITNLEDNLERWKYSVIKKVLHHFQIQKHEQEIRDKSETRDVFESEYEAMRMRAEQLHEQMVDKSELEQAKSVFKNFYQEQWVAYQEDHKIRDVGNVSEEYEAVFVHGIHPSYIPQVNSLLNEWVDWKTKLKIILALGPTISTSTMRAGEDAGSLWARMGVVVSGGSVQTANARDAATRALGLKKRVGWSFQKDIEGEIKEAVTQKRAGHYNELTVENPTIAGFFIVLDGAERRRRSDRAPVEEIIPLIRELDIPLYVMREGEIYEAEYTEAGGLMPREKLSPREIASRSFEMSHLLKEKLLEEILNDSPFRIASSEVGYVHSMAQGKETYVEIVAPKNLQSLAEEKGARGEEHEEILLEGKKAALIAEFPEIGSKVQYLVVEGRLYRRRENIHTKAVSVDPIRRFDPQDLGYISIGFSTHNVGNPVKDTEAYLSGMESSIAQLKQERLDWTARPTDEKSKQMLALYDSHIGRLAFHLYGFGEQAEAMGDATTKHKTKSICSCRGDFWHGCLS